MLLLKSKKILQKNEKVTCRVRETPCAGEEPCYGRDPSPARHRSHAAYLALSLQTLCNNKQRPSFTYLSYHDRRDLLDPPKLRSPRRAVPLACSTITLKSRTDPS